MESYRVVLSDSVKAFVGVGTITTNPTNVQVSLGPNVVANIEVQKPEMPFLPAAHDQPYTYAHASTKNKIYVLVNGKKTHSYPRDTRVELRKANDGSYSTAMFFFDPKILPDNAEMMGMGRRSKQNRRSRQSRKNRSRQSRKSRQSRSRKN